MTEEVQISSSSLNKGVGKRGENASLETTKTQLHEPKQWLQGAMGGRLGWWPLPGAATSLAMPVSAWAAALPWLRYLAQLQVGERAGVDEGLGDHGQTGIDVVGLVDVEHKLGVLQDVHPKPQW